MKTSKTILVLLLAFFVIGWSIWAWTFYPRTYSGIEIQSRCEKQERKSPYCIGYDEGYDWATKQIEIQRAMDDALDEMITSGKLDPLRDLEFPIE